MDILLASMRNGLYSVTTKCDIHPKASFIIQVLWILFLSGCLFTTTTTNSAAKRTARKKDENLRKVECKTHLIKKCHLEYLKKQHTALSRGIESSFGYWNRLQNYYTHKVGETVRISKLGEAEESFRYMDDLSMWAGQITGESINLLTKSIVHVDIISNYTSSETITIHMLLMIKKYVQTVQSSEEDSRKFVQTKLVFNSNTGC